MTHVNDPLAGLTPAQRAAVALKLRQRRAGREPSRIGRRANLDRHELSFAQHRLWFVEQVSASAANHIAGAVRVKGPLSVETLEQTLGEIVRRHEILRTTYVEEEGRPVPRLSPPAPVRVAVQDVGDDGTESRLERARIMAADDAERPFDLANSPLLRATLFRLGDSDCVLLLVVHHIAADGWSMGVLAREISVLYHAFLTGLPSPLAEPEIQYSDFAVWQRQYVSGARRGEQLAWWQERLRGLTTLHLPADRPRPAVPTSAGARATIGLSADLTAALKSLSQRADATLFMTLLAAFQALLTRWTGQTDITVGSPVAGRNWREVEPLVGLFVNTLALRSDVSGNPSFSELLSRVRLSVTGALAHQDVPFDALIDALHVERSLSQASVTPVVFALQNVPTTGLAFPGATLSIFEIERNTARFDLCLFVQETPDGLAVAAEYSTDVFEPPRVDRLLRGYRQLLQGVVADPGRLIAELPVQEDKERRRLLVEWNETQRSYPRDDVIHALVARQAAERPDAVALSCAGRTMTYGVLEQSANVMAQVLVSMGAGPGDRVGVCVDRSLDLIVALLAVLKCGSAYVALDPAYPAQRLASMVAMGGVSIIVAEPRHVATLGACPAAVVTVEQLMTGSEGVDTVRPVRDVHPDDLAYISFTSGSTGVPKGVEVPHLAVLRLLCGADYVRLGRDETLLQLAPVAFDASTLEIWGALLHGGRLAIYPERVPEFEALERTLAAEGITTLWLTASLFNAVIDRSPGMLRGVRQLLVGGEALSREHVRRAVAALPETTIINGYGPTEGTTFTCCHPITRGDVERSQSISIGRPIANTTVYVLDAWLEPVPIGVPGELYIGGDGLARGYASEPRLTGERFIPDSFSGRVGARLYRSGDLVQYREDGTLEFLGRRDGQIKLRGYRIELGEIEATLMRHPNVSAAVAAVRDVEGRPLLAAYVVASSADTGPASELSRYLKDRLPDYMLPAAIMPITAIPLTANGKVDRDALPPPTPAGNHQPLAPRNEMDELVLSTCGELLGTQHLAISDNFFTLGGHSLLVTQLASRLQRALQTDVSIRTIFESRTLAELSDLLVDQVLDEPDEAEG